MFEYVAENMEREGCHGNFAEFPNLPEDTCNAVKYLAGQIETIDYLKPLKAIEFIEKECEYEKYIRRASKEMGIPLIVLIILLTA